MKTLALGFWKISLDLTKEEEDILMEAIQVSVRLAQKHHNFRRQA